MAVPAIAAAPEPSTPALEASSLLDIVEKGVHASRAEWMFLRELRVGTGHRNGNGQRLDAFALNALPHTGMKRICYEVKVSRADFLAEVRNPLKRRAGMRFSNEFYFLTPAGLVSPAEVPPECGVMEAGFASPAEWRTLFRRQAGLFSYDPQTQAFCMITIPAPWRDTPGPSWQLVAAMLRNQRREFEEKPMPPPAQQRLTFR